MTEDSPDPAGPAVIRHAALAGSPVTRLHPRTPAVYNDTAALNDIHALLTTSRDCARDQIADLGLILARTGRPLIPVRGIEVTIADTPDGRPVARTISGPATVTVRQEPAGPGLLIEITTTPPGAADDITVIAGGRCLSHPSA